MSRTPLLGPTGWVTVSSIGTRRRNHFVTPTWIPVVAGLCTFYLVGPWTGRPLEQFSIALVLLAIGAVLGVVTYLINRTIKNRPTQISHEEYLSSDGTRN